MTQFTIETVEDAPAARGKCCVFVDPDNNPHIAFGTTAGHAAIASRTGSTWAVEEIFGSGALRPEVEERVWFQIDSVGNPHIAFIAMGGTAFHGVRLEGRWTFTELPTNRFNEPGGVSGLSFKLHPGRQNPDLKDTPHIITSDQSTDALVYLRLVDGAFKRVVVTEPVDLSGDGDFTRTGLHSSMMFDDLSETIQMAYVEEAADTSRVKSRRILEPGGESFSNEFPFDNGRFFVAATSVFSGFETWIAYCNITDRVLNVAANVSGLDITEKVADVQGRMVPSMARNEFLGGSPEETLRIAYSDNERLKLASRRRGQGWVLEEIDDAAPGAPSLAYDRNATGHIAYAVGTTLKYAKLTE
jgi:hypothetical protein